MKTNKRFIILIRLGLTVMALTGLSSIRAANATTDVLTFVEAYFDDTSLDGVISVAVSPDGNHVYAAGSIDDAVVVFARDENTGALAYVEVEKDGVGGVDGLNDVRSISVSPDGDHVYAASFIDSAVVVFGRNEASGALTFVETQRDGIGGVDGLKGAISIAVSPDGNHVYAAGCADNAVAVFGRDEATGALTFLEMEKDGVGGVDGLAGAVSIAVSPDGDHIYVASINDDAVAVFGRNKITGMLDFVETQRDGVGGVDGLDGATAVTVSPDGNHVYAAGYADDAVVVFSRNGSSGALTFLEMEKDGVGGVDGLNDVRSIAVSPDGDHVYATGALDDAVVVFGRDGTTGELTYVEMHKDGVDGVDGLDSAHSITVSPDGRHVYTAASVDNAVAVFDRGTIAGGVDYVEMEKDGVGGVDGLYTAYSVIVSPDGDHVYAAGYNDDAVVVFSQNRTTGALTFVEMQKDDVGNVNGLNGASSVALSPDGHHVYATGSIDDAVAVFDRDATTGVLTFIEMEKDGIGPVDGLDGATSVAISPDGDHVYVAGFEDNAVAVFDRNRISGELTFVETEQDGVGGVDGLAGAYAVTISPDGDHVYVAGASDDAVAVFGRDATTGVLTYVEVEKDGVGGVDGLNGATSVAVSPDGHHVYATGYQDDAVAVFNRSETSGTLTYVEMEKDGVNGVDGLNSAYSVAVSPDGDHVYVASGADDAVAAFDRDGTTGELTFIEMEKDGVAGVDGLDGALSIAVSPDGHYVCVASSADSAVAVLSRDRHADGLTYVATTWQAEGLDGARSVAVSPDGRHVYAAGYMEDALVFFRRNNSTGALAYVGMQQDGVGGVDGLDGAWAVAVSPDGYHVYVAAYADAAVAVFSRNAATGGLTYVEVEKDGVGGVDGLSNVTSVAVSPDGNHVYATGSNDDAIAVFGRDEITGELTFLQVIKDTSAGVDGLDCAYSVAVSPDGNHVYVASYNDDAVAIFDRNGTTGMLTFAGALLNGIGGVEGLNGAWAVTVSPDGDHVYVASSLDDAVVVYSRSSNGQLNFVEMEQDGVGGVDGLDYPRSVVVSPGGDYVYVAGYTDDAVAVFDRDGTTGELTFVEVHKDGVDGVDGLNSVHSVAVSPDANHVYAASYHDDAVTVFERQSSSVYIPLVLGNY